MERREESLALSLLAAIKKWRVRYDQAKTEAGDKGEMSREAQDILYFASGLWKALGSPRDLQMVRKASVILADSPGATQALNQDPFEIFPF